MKKIFQQMIVITTIHRASKVLGFFNQAVLLSQGVIIDRSLGY